MLQGCSESRRVWLSPASLYSNRKEALTVEFLRLRIHSMLLGVTRSKVYVSMQQDEMQKHLQDCLEQQEFTPFPQTRETIVRYKRKHHYIRLYCKCSLPESYDRQMIKYDSCYKWYHFRCVGLVSKPKSRKWACIFCT